jgi:hypothetical protein
VKLLFVGGGILLSFTRCQLQGNIVSFLLCCIMRVSHMLTPSGLVTVHVYSIDKGKTKPCVLTFTD